MNIPTFINTNIKPNNVVNVPNKSQEIHIDLFQNKIMKKKTNEKVNLNYTNNLFNYKYINNSSVDHRNKILRLDNPSKTPDTRKDSKYNPNPTKER